MSSTIFGHIRFSYLGRSDVKLARRDAEVRRQTLYAPERLEERLWLFEKICLPSLRWQTDSDFRVAVYTSPELPDPFKERLERAVRSLPQAEVVYDQAEHITGAVQAWSTAQPVTATHRCAHFRLDDDDALSVDFIAAIRAAMGGVPNRCLITLPRGLLLANTPEGAVVLEKYEPCIAIGYTVVCDPGDIFSPYQLSHRQYAQHNPSLTLPQRLSYIHTVHRHADTVSAQGRKLITARTHHDQTAALRPRRFRAEIAQQFGGHRIRDLMRIISRAPGRLAED